MYHLRDLQFVYFHRISQYNSSQLNFIWRKITIHYFICLSESVCLLKHYFVYLSLHQRTALHLAVIKAQKHIVERLVEKKAAVSIKDKAGVRMWDYTTDGYLVDLEPHSQAERTASTVHARTIISFFSQAVSLTRSESVSVSKKRVFRPLSSKASVSTHQIFNPTDKYHFYLW